MNVWIIADADKVAARVHESLLCLSIDCPATHIARIDSVGPMAESFAGCDGLVFFAASQLQPAHFETLRRLRAVVQDEAKLVVISSVGDHGTVLKAIRAGANDVLSGGEDLPEELASFVARIKSEQKQKHDHGRTISIVPCHAPSDASLVAVNVAAVIARREGLCGLLDFHLRGGDLALLLKLSPRHTMFDLLDQQVTIDEAMFEQALTPHESGIKLLAGPNAFVDLKHVSPQAYQQIINLAHRSHPFLVINSEDVQHAEQVRALAASDEIVLTMRLDVVSLYRAKQHFEFMTHNQVLGEHIHVVALGVGHCGELPVAAVKKVLQTPTLHCIPDDPVATIRSINVGNPLVCESPHARISQAIAAFADLLAGHSDGEAKAPSRSCMASVKAAAAVALSSVSKSQVTLSRNH